MKPSSRPTKLSQLKTKLLRVTKQLEFRENELAEASAQQIATSAILRVISGSPTNMQPVMDAIAENAARLCNSDDAEIYRVEGDMMQKIASWGFFSPTSAVAKTKTISRELSCGRAILDRQTIHIRGTLAELDEGYEASSYTSEQVKSRTVLAVPLLREGDSVGVIIIRRIEARPFSKKQISLLKTFADTAVIAIENARLLHEQQTRNRELSALYDVSASASQSLEIKPVLQEVVKKITEIFNFDAVRIRLFDARKEFLCLAASYGVSDDAFAPMDFPRNSLMGKAAETGVPIIFENAKTDAQYEELSQTKGAKKAGYSLFGLFPITAKGKPAGVIICLGQQPRKLPQEEIRLITSMSDQIGVALENINLFNQVDEKSRQLQLANLHKSRFLANVNHELRTPVSAIIGYARLLRRKTAGQIPLTQREYLDDLLNNAERLLSQIDSLLDLAKIEAGKIEVRVEPVAVDEVIAATAATIAPMLNPEQVRFVRQVAASLPLLHTDREKLRQILLNLLSNAAKYTERGEIKIAAAALNGGIEFAVSDTGVGIKEENLDRIFEEFERAEPSCTEVQHGTGLGLAIVKEFVHLLGGEIGVKSKPGEGSTFTVVLPWSPPERATF